MPATFPATKPENWADAIILRPTGESKPEGSGAPRFALLETGWPDPWALAFSVLFLSTLISLSIIVTQFQSFADAPIAENVVELHSPPLRAPTDISTPNNSNETTTPLPQPAEPVTAESPSPELPGFGPPSAPVQPLRPEPLRPTPLQADTTTPDPFAGQPIPRELMENPPPLPVQPQPAVVSKNVPPVMPAAAAAAKPNPTAVPSSPGKIETPNRKLAQGAANSRPVTLTGAPMRAPDSLGVLPLADLIDNEAGLAAGLAALPSAQRVNLPRVSIRVNSDWFRALSQTKERLYFSITTPEGDGEVLAYVPDTQSFNLERAERPLWQIRDGERVPALAALRVAAGRWLGVSPELVGIYTWHPPVLENALRMFVMERMQDLHVQLGPRDMVTVRLSSGFGGAVMNLEPIRARD
ncbi:MAG TPA: hypothetical protein VGV68_11455 [Terriglobia bacterium]|nr:hypothetical protein [Terriglobia bacterium]